jgi:hypothetical protein
MPEDDAQAGMRAQQAAFSTSSFLTPLVSEAPSARFCQQFGGGTVLMATLLTAVGYSFDGEKLQLIDVKQSTQAVSDRALFKLLTAPRLILRSQSTS